MPTRPFKSLTDVEVTGRRVLLRVDLNVPLKEGPDGPTVADTYRLEAVIPTISYLRERGAKIIILSHLGRPDGVVVPALSLAPVAACLSQLIGAPIKFVPALGGKLATDAIAALPDGGLLMLENLRFHPGEEANDDGFARDLAALGDLYINDAFAVSHRAHASVAAITKFLPHVAGLLLQHELTMLTRALGAPSGSAAPLLAIVGGAKISTKLQLLDHIAGQADTLFIGGAMANTFLAAQGVDIGISLAEPSMIPIANQIILKAQTSQRCEIMLPLDAIVAPAPNSSDTHTVPVMALPTGTGIYDIGPATLLRLQAAIEAARTIIWNGPVGLFEQPAFSHGTFELVKMLAHAAQQGKVVVAGGGDTVAALAQTGLTDQLTFVSTAGGAFLEWLEGKTLPGIAALSEDASS